MDSGFDAAHRPGMTKVIVYRQPPHASCLRLDLYLLALLRLGLAHGHLEDALGDLGGDIFRLNTRRQFDGARERAEAALDQVVILALFLALVLLFAANGEKVVGEIELDVRLLDTGQFRRDFDRLVVSLRSMLGSVLPAAVKPGKLREKPSNRRSASCCRNANG
jgi:hypothetical protein